MVELSKEQANSLYNKIKKNIIAKKNNPDCRYIKKQLNVFAKDYSAKARANFFKENGEAKFVNKNGDTIVLSIYRYHNRLHNVLSSYCPNPSFTARIFIEKENEREKIWELVIEAGTFDYKAAATSLEIPEDLLKPAKTKTTDIEKQDTEDEAEL